MKSDTIQRIEIWPIDVPITDPFVVATGARVTAQNLFVRVTLRDGTCGYGEAAPFPEVGGEDRASCFDTATVLATPLVGQSVAGYQSIADTLQAQAILYPAARCGLETAILDAYTRSLGVPLWQLWGSADVRIGKPTSPFLSANWRKRWISLAAGMPGDFDSLR